MVTWWSRLHDEPYLRRRRGYGEVEDVEGLTVVLWFWGIRQWRLVRVIWLTGITVFPVTALTWKRTAEGEMVRGRGRE